MSNMVLFTPRHDLSAKENFAEFIRVCRYDLTIFGADLDWESYSWHSAGVAFGNIEQTTRKLRPENAMKEPFAEFAKAYFRYQQGIRPNKSKTEMRALKCLERALDEGASGPNIAGIRGDVLDRAAVLARNQYSPGAAYHAGRELEELARFVSEKRLVPTALDWKNPIGRPQDTVRTGKKAREDREKKLPSMEALDALAQIFASSPTVDRDIFTTSTAAMLLSAPSRGSEVLALMEDCQVVEAKRDGGQSYGWRFMPGKGAPPMIKWIPEAMVALSREAITRVRRMTHEARQLASWLETHPDKFYRHKNCPHVADDAPLTVGQVALALGINREDRTSLRAEMRRLGLSPEDGVETLSSLNRWVHARLPVGFPWFDKEKGLRYSKALFCMRDKQLRTDFSTSPCELWKPTINVFNNDLGPRGTAPGYTSTTVFDRHDLKDCEGRSFKVTSHQFRHLLNTMAQRGGLSQSEIARWSGRTDVRENRVYNHMTEFELVEMLRDKDPALTLDRPLTEIAENIASVIPITRQEFNSLTMPTAHVTEFGFCVHDYVMSPCQMFRDCLNCSEQICIKGDARLGRIKTEYEQVRQLKERAEYEIAEGTAGADRWYEIHSLTEKRVAELIAILEDSKVPDGAIVRLRNEQQFSPIKRALSSRKDTRRLHQVEREESLPLIESGK
ncbi:hypothetical protein [Rudaea cellulosilytica]|uniref:hypothetical protein n=1 Tax=Rudaea cellulosilytica TaxID=540746 RepID=UPI00039F8D66|nr:hypothetical protein [Rudaea cellulosilytica]